MVTCLYTPFFVDSLSLQLKTLSILKQNPEKNKSPLKQIPLNNTTDALNTDSHPNKIEKTND